MGTRLLVLIVEDDRSLAKMYSEKLEIEGFLTRVARDGEEGLRMAEETNPDIILLDLMLPKLSGNELLEKYRKTEEGKNKPVIALTNAADDFERGKSMKLGVKEYLIKATTSPEDVVEKIKMNLSKFLT